MLHFIIIFYLLKMPKNIVFLILSLYPEMDYFFNWSGFSFILYIKYYLNFALLSQKVASADFTA